MAYVTGSVSSMADLLAGLQAACTANGWTLRGTVLSKGNCYMRVQIVSGFLTVLGGTGVDGSNNLTGPAVTVTRMGLITATDTLTFPVNYAVHIGTAPDEVYLVVNYEINRWQWMAFGCSPVAGLPGTGNWYGATLGNGQAPFSLTPTVGAANWTQSSGALFFSTGGTNSDVCFNSYIQHGLDGATWSGQWTLTAQAINALQPLLPRQPNAWNGETALLPIQPYVSRPSSKVSMVGDLAHARYLRNDNYADGDVITLGSDRWKVYPWVQKNSAARDGGGTIMHSGTLGWAIRYDGP